MPSWTPGGRRWTACDRRWTPGGRRWTPGGRRWTPGPPRRYLPFVTIVNKASFDEKMRVAAAAVPAQVLDGIRDFLLTAEDARLFSMNPWRIAAERGLDRMGSLKAMLHLT